MNGLRQRFLRSGRPELYLVTDRDACKGRPLIDLVGQAVAGGVSIVQLREKRAGGREFAELARALVRLLGPLGVPLLVNDRVDIALAVGAQGVHLGQSDLSPLDARAILGPDAVIGLTVESFEEVHAVDPRVVDHLGASVFPTGTKTDVRGVFGLEGMRRLVASAGLPVVAIGGIQASNAAAVAATGVAALAVVSAVLSADDAHSAAKTLCTACAERP